MLRSLGDSSGCAQIKSKDSILAKSDSLGLFCTFFFHCDLCRFSLPRNTKSAKTCRLGHQYGKARSMQARQVWKSWQPRSLSVGAVFANHLSTQSSRYMRKTYYRVHAKGRWRHLCIRGPTTRFPSVSPSRTSPGWKIANKSE